MTDASAIDHRCMARALRLAERGMYTTQPNPRVGCVIAHGDEVVGEGWHQRAGEAHAEVHALREAGERARGATAYVTLEPCGLHGRTPPCADALIAAGIGRVVIACEDADQRSGGALDRLRAAGIVVETGLMRDAARELNRGFFSRVERGRPWVRVKLAMSLDGRTALANGESFWITGEAARADVQRWRARSSAILTGSGTVLADDPRLTVRLCGDDLAEASGDLRRAAVARIGGTMAEAVATSLGGGGVNACGGSTLRDATASGASNPVRFVPPLRVVIDRALRTPAAAHVLDGSVPTLLIHAGEARVADDDRFERVECLSVASGLGGIDLAAVLTLLAQRGCNEVQVEAGARLTGALFATGLVDELLLYVAPVLLGSSARPLLDLPPLAAMSERWHLDVIDQRSIGGDWRLLLRPR